MIIITQQDRVMRQILLLCFLCCSLVSFTQEPVNLGIFDATADWGLEPDFPPQLGEFKVPGRVEVSMDGDDVIYDLYGNGDTSLKGLPGYPSSKVTTSDEGFYVYSTQSGSWSISAEIQYEHSQEPRNGFFGLMIREEGSKTDSKYIWHLLAKRYFSKGFLIRSETSSETFNEDIWFGLKWRYLRLTRIAPKNMFITENSMDGVTWKFYEHHRLEMSESVSYGLAITNATDNETLDQVRFVNAKLEPAIPAVFRSFNPKSFEPGEKIHVHLEIFNAANENCERTLTEVLPNGWYAEQISHSGEIQDGTIEWNLTLNPGITNVEYTAVTPNYPNNPLLFSGQLGTLPVLGEQSVLQKLTSITASQPIHWRYWDSSDGMTQTNTINLSVNPSGNVWASHYNNSLSRFDGFKILPIPVTNLHHAVKETPSGKVWGMYMDSYESFMNEEHPESGHYIPERITGFQSFLPNEFYINHENSHWNKSNIHEIRFSHPYFFRFFQAYDNQVIVSYSGRILSYHEKSKHVELIKSKAETTIGGFMDSVQETQNILWVSGENGIAKLKKSGEVFDTASEWTEYLFDPVIPFDQYMQPIMRKDGVLIFNAYSNVTQQWGLVMFDGESWKTLYSSTSYYDPSMIYSEFNYDVYDRRPMSHAILGDEETVWLHQRRDSGQNVLMKIFAQNQKEEIQDSGLLGNIYQVEIDNEGAIWAATSDGLARMAPRTWKTPQEVSGINTKIYSIAETKDGTVWFSTKDNLIGEKQGQWKIYRWLDNYEVSFNSMLVKENDSLFFDADYKAGQGNLLDVVLEFNPLDEMFQYIERPPNNVFKGALTGDDGSILMLMIHEQNTHVLKYFRKHFETLIPYGIIRSSVVSNRSFFQSKDDSLWIGESDHISVYNNGNYKTYNLNDEALYIQEISDGIIWVGTNKGILQFDGIEWSEVNTTLGTVNDIQVSNDGSVWVASRTGVHRYHLGSWQINTKDDGLPHESTGNIFVDSQGRVWAGTAKGISLYDPNADKDPPQTLMSEENVNEIASGGGKFVYSGMDKWKYTRQEHLLYSHRIDDGEWTPFTPETVASVSALPARKYKLQVRAMDRNWNIDPTPAVWYFEVVSPWYLEPVFHMLMTGSGIIIIFLTLLHFRHHLNLGRLVEDRTAHLQAEINERKSLQHEILNVTEREQNRLGRDLHDSINQKLSVASLLSKMLKKKLLDKENEEAKDAEKIADIVNDAINHTRGLAKGLSPASIETHGIVTALKELASDISTLSGIICCFHNRNQFNISDLQMSTNLYRIAQEAVKNAIHHGDAKQIDLTLSSSNGHINLTIQDDGCGFDPIISQNGGMGLRSMKHRASLFDGKLEVDSDLGKGTTITCFVPIQNKE